MSDIEILGLPQSNYVRTVRMACEEKGIPYTLKPVLPRSAEVMAINPFGRIPVMRHDGFTLFESKAIATYIDRAFTGPKLIPDDPRLAATVEQWICACTTVIFPATSRYIQCYAFPKDPSGVPDRAEIDKRAPECLQYISLLDRAVSATGCLAGETLTLADLYPLPVLAYLRDFPESAQAMQTARSLDQYFKQHALRASFRNTVPPPIEDLQRLRESLT